MCGRLHGDAMAEGSDIESHSCGVSELGKPIQFGETQGAQATDLLWSQPQKLDCVSERIMRILTENECGGRSMYHVEVFD